MKRVAASLAVLALLVAACGETATHTSAVVVPRRPCVGARPPAHYDHVVLIWMENHSYRDVIGNAAAPYETALAGACATASSYYGVTHPSLPNYIAATSGSTWGIADDDGPASHVLRVPSIYSQVASWREYEESSPGPCPTADSGDYAQKHDPALYYSSIRKACRRADVPLGEPGSGALAHDLRADRLAEFSLITPNLCHDTHDCSVATGDEWLRGWMPSILGSTPFRSGRTAVFIVWDESEGSSFSPIPFIALARSVEPGTVVTRRVSHYSLLRATEELLGLPLLANARQPSAAGLAFALGLSRK